MKRKLFAIVMLLGVGMAGLSAPVQTAQAGWFSGSIASYASCMITHAPIFIQYNYTGAEAEDYCWSL